MKTIISLAQFEIKFNDFEDAFQRAEGFISQATKKQAQFICFPEYFITGEFGYYTNDPELIQHIIKELPDIFKHKFKSLSVKYRITIIAGTIPEEIEPGTIVNRSYIFDKGKIIHHYNKLNLYSTENNVISPGNQLPEVVEVNGIKIGVLICKDIYYSNIFQHLAKKGAQIVFVPSYWSANCTDYQVNKDITSKYKGRFLANNVTKILGQARAIENGMYVVFVNCCGHIKFKDYFDSLMGKSFIASPVEGIIAKTAYLKKEVLITSPIDLTATTDANQLYDLF